jgi:hypothetical protein
MKIGIVLALAIGLATAAFAQAPASTEGQWTGYITDTHCGAKGAVKDHTAACVEKCMKSGSKAQIANEGDKQTYNLDSFDKVKDLMGHKVTVKGTLDEKTHTITVASASKADQ